VSQLATDGAGRQVRSSSANTGTGEDGRSRETRRDALKLARSYRAGELTPVGVPDAADEALRDLVRAREAAKRDQLRARNRLTKFLLRHGKRPPEGVNPWTLNYMNWVKKEVHFEPTLLDYLHEVDHMAARVTRLEQAIEKAAQLAPHQMREVIEALQALRGIAKVSAVTIVAAGTLQRRGLQKRWHHQDRQCAPASHCRGGCLDLPPRASGNRLLAQAAKASE
jgi:transposase